MFLPPIWPTPHRGSIRITCMAIYRKCRPPRPPTTDEGGEAVRGTERGLGSQQALTKGYSCVGCFAARIH